MAKGAQDEAFLHGYSVLFGSTDNNYIQEEKFLDALKAKMVDGIIYVSSNPATSEKLLENITVPVVFMDRKIKKRENMGSVLIDNFSAMKDVAAYIAGKGCRQPAYITADISLSPSKERYEGFVEGLEEKGVCDIMEYHGYGVEIFDAWTDYCLMNPETTLSLDKKSTA